MCVGLILTTYIPFFFLTILTIISFLYVLFYRKEFVNLLKRIFTFFRQNKIFTAFCIVFLLIACIPALIFYKESKGGEFVLPSRHSGAGTSSSAVAVAVDNAASADIISHGYFDRLFDDHAHIDMGDVYMPYIFFLLLLTAIAGRVNKFIFFLLFNILALSFITVTSAGEVHRFLYAHIAIFKYIRQIYYFFWLAMLPLGILLSVAVFKSLLTAINSSSKKISWLIYIIICHLIFIVFLWGHQGILWGAWAAICISLLYFLVYFRYEEKISYPAGFCLFLMAVLIQSVQVYSCLDKKLFKLQADALNYIQTHDNRNYKKLDLYYTTRWFQVLIDQIDADVLGHYRIRQFIIYDNVVPYTESVPFFKKLETALSSNANVAFVSKIESASGDWKISPDAMPQADIDPLHSGKLSVVRSDTNTWALKTNLTSSQFLVINDNYNSDWHAFINGHQARLFRANVSFNGLWVPSGESSIVIRFSTPGRYIFHFTMIILFAGTFLYLLVLFKKDQTLPASGALSDLQ